MAGTDSQIKLEAVWGKYGAAQSAAVAAVAFAPDGRSVWTGNSAARIGIWSMPDAIEQACLRGPQEEIRDIAFAPDGRTAITAGGNGAVLWDTREKAALLTFGGHRLSTRSVAVSGDGLYGLSCGSDGLIKMWNLTNGELRREFRGHRGAVNAARFSRDGSIVLSAGDDRTLRIWETASGVERHRLTGHTRAVNCVAIQADGARALSGSDDGTLILWDLSAGSALQTWRGHDGPVTALAVSAAAAISAGEDGTLRVWENATGAEIHVLFGHLGPVRAVALSPDGAVAVSGGDDQTVRCWDMASGDELIAGGGHRAEIRSLALSTDRQRVLSGSVDQSMCVWSIAERTPLRNLNVGATPIAAAFSGPLSAIAIDDDGLIAEWDIRTGDQIAEFPTPYGALRTAAMSVDGRRLVVGAPGKGMIWSELRGGAKLRESMPEDAQSGDWSAVAVSPDSMYAAAGAARNLVTLWNLHTGAMTQRSYGEPLPEIAVTALAFSPDSRTLAAAHSEGIVLWRVAGDVETEPRLLPGHDSDVRFLAFTSDGKWILSGAGDYTIRLRNIATGETSGLIDLSDRGDIPTAVVMMPGGREFLAGTARGVILQGRLFL